MLHVHNLAKSYSSGKQGEHNSTHGLAVDGVTFDVERGELVTLVGPSGCGKTTTLRSIAGLEQPSSGIIRVGDRTVFSSDERINIPANQRDLSMVFQSYAIWPHMDVFHNVSFPLEVTRRKKNMSAREIRSKVDNALEAVELGSYRDRPATNLSGGQQQRLALARAMVTEPELVLLDEPLSNLDAKLRETMRLELKRMQRELGLTMLYVTHDQQEALALSTSVAVMNKGKIVQNANPREIYSRPRNRFVADFIGAANFIQGTVVTVDGERTKVSTREGELWTTTNSGFATGEEVTVSIRPENIEIHEDLASTDSPNVWQGRVLTRGFLGEVIDHVIAVGAEEIRCRSNPSTSIPPNSTIHMTVHPENVLVLPIDE